MAKKSEIQYIRLYTDGSAARKLEFTTELPKQRPQKKQRRPQQRQQALQIVIDPVALCGIVLAAVMVVMMAVGVVRLSQVSSEAAVMENYVQQLQEKKERLESIYHSSYDLDAVKQAALGLGMIPIEQAETVLLPAIETEDTDGTLWWEDFAAALWEIFA